MFCRKGATFSTPYRRKVLTENKVNRADGGLHPTQYHSANNEPVRLYEVGPGVTDGLRKELKVPPLDEAKKREAEMGKLFKVK